MEMGGLTIFWEGHAHISFTLVIYLDGRYRKNA